jgi:hypothetical protein
MKPESETVAALRRAGRRALFHLVRAAVEGLKAIEAVVDELARAADAGGDQEDDSTRHRIEVE